MILLRFVCMQKKIPPENIHTTSPFPEIFVCVWCSKLLGEKLNCVLAELGIIAQIITLFIFNHIFNLNIFYNLHTCLCNEMQNGENEKSKHF